MDAEGGSGIVKVSEIDKRKICREFIYFNQVEKLINQKDKQQKKYNETLSKYNKELEKYEGSDSDFDKAMDAFGKLVKVLPKDEADN